MGKFPTPNEPAGNDMILAGLWVNASDYTLQANIHGAISLLFDAYSFEKYGQMTPERAAEYYRNLEFAMDFCDYIASCIDTSESVKKSLANWYVNNIGFNTPADNVAGLGTEIASQAGACNYDELYGNCVALWTAINARTLDWLQVISESGNVLELAANVIEAIPVINQLPIDDMIEQIGKFADWSLENYNAALTIEIEQKIVCDLFCIAKDNCRLTFQETLTYFSDYFTEDISLWTIVELASWVTGIAPAGETFVYAASLFQLWFAATASKFLNNNSVQWYQLQARLGTDSNDWETLCDCPVVYPDVTCNGDGSPSTLLEVINVYDSGLSAGVTQFGTWGTRLASLYQECYNDSGWVYNRETPQCLWRIMGTIGDYTPVTNHTITIHIDGVQVYSQNVHPISNMGTLWGWQPTTPIPFTEIKFTFTGDGLALYKAFTLYGGTASLV